MSKEQQNLDAFKILMESCIKVEAEKIKNIKEVNKLVLDKDLTNHISRRDQFYVFCTGSRENLDKVPNYAGNEQYIDKIQKDFYLTTDGLKKEALKMMSKNQKQWFSILFDKDFDKLKLLLRSLLVFEAEHEKTQIERIVQEVELLRYSK